LDKIGNIFVLENNQLSPILQLPSKNAYYDIIDIDSFQISPTSLPSDNFTLFNYKGSKFLAISTGIKAFTKLDNNFGLISASGFVGIFNEAFPTINRPGLWDKWVGPSKNNFTILDLKHTSPILKDVRSKSNAYDSKNKVAYISSNIGLFALSPDTLVEL
jgi:hypothetical protein